MGRLPEGVTKGGKGDRGGANRIEWGDKDKTGEGIQERVSGGAPSREQSEFKKKKKKNHTANHSPSGKHYLTWIRGKGTQKKTKKTKARYRGRAIDETTKTSTRQTEKKGVPVHW